MNNLDIEKIRKKLDLTQEEFGKLLGVSVRTVANWEKSGKIPGPMTNKINELELGYRKDQPHSDHLGRMLSIIEEQGKTFRETMARSQDEIDRLLAIIERQQQPLTTTESSSKKHAG